jgi:HAD superfamily hydrolase (TIGR01509 family)
MALSALIFDLDGSLIDTNAAHIEAWRRAFAAHGLDVPPERIAAQIGKGSDQLVPSLLGEAEAQRLGKQLAERHTEEFLKIAAREHFRVFPGVHELLARLREEGIRTALATSSKENQLRATLDSAGVDLTREVDVVVTADAAPASKPAADLICATLDRLNLPADRCAMVGDTVYDVEAATKAGVICVAVLCGGTSTADGLLQAGARAVYRDPADLLDHLPEVLRLGPGRSCGILRSGSGPPADRHPR